MWHEFKEFAFKGNVVDLAVAFILGGAFGKIVTSLVSDIIMPPIGMLLGRVDFASLFINLSGGDYPSVAAAREAGAATINYGIFINTFIEFLIVAFALYLVIKQVNRVRKPVAVTSRPCPYCTTQIPLAASRCPACTSSVEPAPAVS